MALSGSLNTTDYEGRYLTLSWTATQSIANNTSTISWTLTGAGQASSSWYYSGNFKVVIAGETVYFSEDRIQLYNGTTVASGTKTISHNTDGTKSVTMSAEAGIYTFAVNCSGSSTFTLTQIPRAATILTAPNFTDAQNPTVTYTNPAGNSVTYLEICMSADDGASVLIGYKALSKTGTSYTFSLTSTEWGYLRSACGNSNSCTISFIIRTYLGGTYYYSKLNKTFSIVGGEPVISPTIYDSNDTTYGLTGSRYVFVKGYSNAYIEMGITPQKGATIVSKKVTCGNKSRTSDGTINAVESGTFVITATDSRGNTTTNTTNFNTVDYVKLSCNISNTTPDTQGNYTFVVTGNYFNSSFGSQSNTLTVQYRYKESGGSYGSWTTMSNTKSGNTYSASASLTGLDYTKSYIFQARATDNLATVQAGDYPTRSLPVFDWSGTDFNFNVPVNFSAGATGAGGGGLMYGTCSTAANQGAKAVDCDGFTLSTGVSIRVYFANGNTISTPTLNVNSTGAKSIVKYGTTSVGAYAWYNGEVVDFVYDGTYWRLVDGGLATTSYYGVTKLQSTISNSSSTALTPLAIYNYIEVDSWTPTFGTAAAINSYTNQYGWYVKIGNVVTGGFYLKATTKSGYTTTAIKITGLPYAPDYDCAFGGVASNVYTSSNTVFHSWYLNTSKEISGRTMPCNKSSAGAMTVGTACYYPSSSTLTLSGTFTYYTTDE